MATPEPPPIRVVGERPSPFRDGYHAFLRAPWLAALGAIVGSYLALNGLFAVAYTLVGGVHGARPGLWRDGFFFSVQTMGTIGYGAMYPESDAAHLLVVAESVCGLVVTALATGLVFAKFVRTTARVQFARHALVTTLDGEPVLAIRLGNERNDRVLGARFSVTMVRTERTAHGVFYRMYDLPLLRAETAALTRAHTLFHRITPESRLHGYDPASLKRDEVELHVVASGTDETTLQPVFALHAYLDGDLRFDARFADMLRELPDGTLEFDARTFHDIVPLRPVGPPEDA